MSSVAAKNAAEARSIRGLCADAKSPRELTCFFLRPHPLLFYTLNAKDIMAPGKAPAGHFSILYFAAASTFTGKTSEYLAAPVQAGKLFALLEERYPGINEKVLSSCALTINMEYVDINEEDADQQVSEGDEVAIIPPVSSG